jgi:hypothetical protein
MIKKYVKKPVEIEAIELSKNNLFEVNCFLEGRVIDNNSCQRARGAWDDYEYICSQRGGLEITTLEGKHLASWGDFIIKGVKGEFYPCKPDIFELTYSEVK